MCAFSRDSDLCGGIRDLIIATPVIVSRFLSDKWCGGRFAVVLGFAGCERSEPIWLLESFNINSQVSCLISTPRFLLPLVHPFADANAEDSGAGTKEYVHIRVQQRNGRKSLTTVQGLKKEFSYNKILKDLKKEFCCNGTVVQDPELGQVIQLQGDQRKNVSTFLVQAGIVKKEHIKIHGF
ncbi:hypothetical protein EUGRSUZ_F03432 [Eucalyptus grandis]|uniref:Uncharacterized protein n=2 Tax=Eucalyptus grandis TaxID=71139 RepID=A0ACC3KLC0_EUCGR|nr:hypothetical protein EUGRSUZ_F03432 [Eucalyptus grandis]